MAVVLCCVVLYIVLGCLFIITKSLDKHNYEKALRDIKNLEIKINMYESENYAYIKENERLENKIKQYEDEFGYVVDKKSLELFKDEYSGLYDAYYKLKNTLDEMTK